VGSDNHKPGLLDRMFRDPEDRPALRPQRETGAGKAWRWALWGSSSRDGTEPALAGRTLAIGAWMILFLGIAAIVPGLGQWRVWPPPPTGPAPAAGGGGEPGVPASGTEPPGDSLTPEEESLLKAELEAPAAPAPGSTAAAWVEPTPAERCRILGCEAAGNRKAAIADALLEATPDIEDPGGRGLARYRSAMQALARDRRGLVRVVHYGDSLITGDFVTGTMRRLLQERFGDGGPGFHLASKAWDW
jgi:hypothetical protein